MNKFERVNIYTVAQEAGVSIKTVSRVINNLPDGAPETRQRIRQIIEQLGYQPNAFARGLVSQKTCTLGLINADFTDASISLMITGAKNTTCRYASTSNHQLLAMEMAGEHSGFVCTVNPVNIPAATHIHYTLPESGQPAIMPLLMDALEMPDQGARLLPIYLSVCQDVYLRHATWELVVREPTGIGVHLVFTTQPGSYGEAAFVGKLDSVQVSGGEITAMSTPQDSLTVFVLHSSEKEIHLLINKV